LPRVDYRKNICIFDLHHDSINLNYELFLAKRFTTSKKYKSSISSPIIKIAISAIALGIAMMLITVATGVGLQLKIREKISIFQGHVQVVNYDNNYSTATQKPISKHQDFYPNFNTVSGIKSVQVYATKAGVIRTEKDFEGVVLKGVDSTYDWSRIAPYLVSGKLPDFSGPRSNEVLLSKTLSNRLGLVLNATFDTYFLKENQQAIPNRRVFQVVGIYNSGFQEFDKSFFLGDIRQIQKLNKWQESQVGGFEILLDDFEELQAKGAAIYRNITSSLDSHTILESYPAIFEWLHLFDTNMYVIIGIMILVAGINMITALLVLVLERTQSIGLLKALGATNWSVRKVFLYNASYLIVRGLFWGNLIGLTLLLLQSYFGLIPLDPETYYVSEVPVYINFGQVFLLNLGTLLLCLFMLLIPSVIITKISPVTALKFE
jgi:lipoprotein-releasing system permease protein